MFYSLLLVLVHLLLRNEAYNNHCLEKQWYTKIQREWWERVNDRLRLTQYRGCPNKHGN